MMTDFGSCLSLQEAFANLTSKLNDSSLFNGYVSFNGMNGLATSVRLLWNFDKHARCPLLLICERSVILQGEPSTCCCSRRACTVAPAALLL